jgi:hypothetical protein
MKIFLLLLLSNSDVSVAKTNVSVARLIFLHKNISSERMAFVFLLNSVLQKMKIFLLLPGNFYPKLIIH